MERDVEKRIEEGEDRVAGLRDAVALIARLAVEAGAISKSKLSAELPKLSGRWAPISNAAANVVDEVAKETFEPTPR